MSLSYANGALPSGGTTRLKVSEAAPLISVSKKYIYRAIHQGRLRAYRYGPHGIRLDLADIEAMADQL
jgi:excisionase family DNA binding protein